MLSSFRPPVLGRPGQALSDANERQEVLARCVQEFGRRCREHRFHVAECLLASLGHLEDLDPPVVGGRPANQFSASLEAVDDVGDPARIHPEPCRELVRRSGWRLTDSPEELGHDLAQAHLLDPGGHDLEVALAGAHQQSPGTPGELLPIIDLIHHISLAGANH